MARYSGFSSLPLLLASLLQFSGLLAMAQSRSEQEVKALFFVTIARYCEWPRSAFASDDSPLVIGILGKDPFGSLLESFTHEEKIRGRAIVVMRFSTVEEIESCHLLFVGEMSRIRLELQLSKLRSREILTVSDQAKFLAAGGAIEMFVNAEKKVRLRISKPALAKTRVILSPSLLRISEMAASFEWVPEIDDLLISGSGRERIFLALYNRPQIQVH